MSVVQIDRSAAFDPEAFFINKWGMPGFDFWRGPMKGDGLSGGVWEDVRSLAITELDTNAVVLDSTRKGREEYIDGRLRFWRLKRSGNILLDAKIFQTLLDSRHLIPDSWKRPAALDGPYSTRILFSGTPLRHPAGDRCFLALCWNSLFWDWIPVHAFASMNDTGPSAILRL